MFFWLANQYFKRYHRHLLEISKDDPEVAHEMVMHKLKKLQKHPLVMKWLRWRTLLTSPALKQEFWGLTFPNPVGLAAGFDKGGEVSLALASLGFGFLEPGAFTPSLQKGNERPRIVRLPDGGLLNRMGFNNPGCEQGAKNLRAVTKPDIPIGINIGKGKDTPLERAHEDYCLVLEAMYLLGDYFVLNISSPNTLGLRDLAKEEYLYNLLRAVVEYGRELARKYGLSREKPILVKLSPDTENKELLTIINTAIECGIKGGIAGNSHMVKHNGLTYGKSGKSLADRTFEMVKLIHCHTYGGPPFVIIACGGIGVDNVAQMCDAGAHLVQIITSFIYNDSLTGVREVVEALAKDSRSFNQKPKKQRAAM